jgi:hypothetical protein
MRGSKAKLVRVSGFFWIVVFLVRVWIMIGNLSELAAMAGMPSEPTIKKLIDENPDFPILSRGRNGVGYEFDLTEAATFIRSLQQRAEQEARARAEDVRQLGLSLLGDDAAAMSQDRVGLSSADRKALMEEELIAIKLAERRGDLIRKDEAEMALGQLALKFRDRYATIADRTAKRITLSREQQTVIRHMVETDLSWIADQLEKLKDAAPTDHGDPAVRNGGRSAAPGGGHDPAQAQHDGQRMGDRASLL